MSDTYDLVDIISNVQAEVVEYSEVMNKGKATTIPISDMGPMAAMFAELSKAVPEVEKEGYLFRVKLPEGTTLEHLVKAKDGSGYRGFTRGDKGISGQVVMNRENEIVHSLEIVDPTMMFMAAAVASVNNKLNDIMELQEDFIRYEKQKDKSNLITALNDMQNILTDFKLMRDDENYKLDKRHTLENYRTNAMSMIDTYRAEVDAELNKSFAKKGRLGFSDGDIQKKIDKVNGLLSDYQLSVYVNAFSSYLAVLLRDNFNTEFIGNVCERIGREFDLWQESCDEAYDVIESKAGKSVQNMFLKGTAIAAKGAGKLIEKTPVVSQGPVDEALIDAGNALKRKTKERVERKMGNLISEKESCVEPFVDGLQTLDIMYNKPIELAFDENNVYYINATAEEA